jgi:hypothetical protein
MRYKKMKVVVKRVKEIKTSTNTATGQVSRGRSVLCDYGDGITAQWKYVGDDCGMKLEEIKPGAEVNMLCDEKGWVTIFEKIGA